MSVSVKEVQPRCSGGSRYSFAGLDVLHLDPGLWRAAVDICRSSSTVPRQAWACISRCLHSMEAFFCFSFISKPFYCFIFAEPLRIMLWYLTYLLCGLVWMCQLTEKPPNPSGHVVLVQSDVRAQVMPSIKKSWSRMFRKTRLCD